MADLIVLSAPLASGKTHFILKFIEEQFDQKFSRKTNLDIFYFAPLRTLVEEFQSKFQSAETINWRFKKPRRIYSVKEYVKEENERGIRIIADCCEQYLHLEKTDQGINREKIFFIDEFHLIFKWGEIFRPMLLEFIYWISERKGVVIGLSGTLKNFKDGPWGKYIELGFENNFFFDFGDGELRFPPKACHIISNTTFSFLQCRWMILARILFSKDKIIEGTTLVFLPTRNLVDSWLEFFEKFLKLAPFEKFKAVHCLAVKGGEIGEFQKILGSNQDDLVGLQKLRIILSTSVLSHGVNLPPVRLVVIPYAVQDFEIWLQMVGRGGRDGGGHEVFSLLPRCNKNQLETIKIWSKRGNPKEWYLAMALKSWYLIRARSFDTFIKWKLKIQLWPRYWKDWFYPKCHFKKGIF